MELVASNRTVEVPQGTAIDYYQSNPILVAGRWIEETRLAAETENYLGDKLQYLFHIQSMALWGPSGGDHAVLDPTQQDNKTDFQKQNVKSLTIGDTRIVRGWATVGDWTGPFLRLSYEGGPDSQLARLAGSLPGPSIQLFLKVGSVAAPSLLTVPYNPLSHRYEIELWNYPGNDLHSRLDTKGAAAMARGELVVRTDLIQGTYADFKREGKDGVSMTQVAPTHTMHPILPLTIEAAWANAAGTVWDSKGGSNYRFQFNMVYRGWDNYLGVGISESPHGGVGFLHYRNLLSNYFGNARLQELGREMEPWMFNAYGKKSATPAPESFFTMDYMDLHVLKPGCSIGLHRHRDNQEIFFLMDGSGLMFCGDWCQLANRERCLEARHLAPGSFSLIKPGGLHGLMNTADENMSLLMFGGYD